MATKIDSDGIYFLTAIHPKDRLWRKGDVAVFRLAIQDDVITLVDFLHIPAEDWPLVKEEIKAWTLRGET